MIQVEQQGETVVVGLTGDIVASTIDEIRRALQPVVAAGAPRVVLDLNGVGMIDSRGLAVFMQCHNSLTARGGALTVLTDNPDFKQLFHVMRMDQHFTVTEAL
jgi:anti-sigma B factor antagonist